jgi:hypothetical protein
VCLNSLLVPVNCVVLLTRVLLTVWVQLTRFLLTVWVLLTRFLLTVSPANTIPVNCVSPANTILVNCVSPANTIPVNCVSPANTIPVNFASPANTTNKKSPRQVAFTMKVVGRCNRVRFEKLVSSETSDGHRAKLNQLHWSIKIFVVYCWLALM